MSGNNGAIPACEEPDGSQSMRVTDISAEFSAWRAACKTSSKANAVALLWSLRIRMLFHVSDDRKVASRITSLRISSSSFGGLRGRDLRKILTQEGSRSRRIMSDPNWGNTNFFVSYHDGMGLQNFSVVHL